MTLVQKSVVHLPKRMARDDERLERLMALHELRENLYYQNGCHKSKVHQKAMKQEPRDLKRLGFIKPGGWLLYNHYCRNRMEPLTLLKPSRI